MAVNHSTQWAGNQHPRSNYTSDDPLLQLRPPPQPTPDMGLDHLHPNIDWSPGPHFLPSPFCHNLRPPAEPSSMIDPASFRPLSMRGGDGNPPATTSTQSNQSDEEDLPTSILTQATVSQIQPSPVRSLQIPCSFQCDLSFVVYCSKKNRQKRVVWKPIRSPKGLSISFNCRSIEWPALQELVHAKCSADYPKLPQLLEDGTYASPPLIAWNGYIHRNGNWPKGRSSSISNPSVFSAWIQAIKNSGASRGGISIKMDNPADKLAQAAQNDMLSETVRRSEARAAQSQGSRSGVGGTTSAGQMGLDGDNPNSDSCNEDFEALAIIKEEIFQKYKENTGVVAAYSVYPDPTNVDRYLILSTGNVALWAKAIHQQELGVSVLSPPACLKYYHRKTKGSCANSSASMPVPSENVPVINSQLIATVVEVCHAVMAQKRSLSPPSSDIGSTADSQGSLIDYLHFCNISNPECTMQILAQHEVDSYQMFAEGYMTPDDLKMLNLSIGTLAKLRNNVGRYQRSLARCT